MITYDDFLAYHLANPDIYAAFNKFAMQALLAGRKRLGAKMLFERIRWYTQVETKGDLKLNNNFHAYYARLWLDNNPGHEGFFVTRRQAVAL